MNHVENANLTKIGLIVDNIEEAAERYCALFNLPMPEIQVPTLDDPPSDQTDDSYTWYRGKRRDTRTKFANLQMGPVTIELLEPLDEPSPWSEFKQKHGQGVHFITFTVKGFEQHIDFLEQQGLPLIHKGEYGSGRYSYFDSEQVLGVTLGIQELGPKRSI
ncbi:VOC family protein [Paenibacillus sp. PL91]|uniref:VOC family protein n=1 Tax=Paenibacillus sp. PL91 TaxID=2729538 RepID=UPI00145EC643|nr:VOC family protein [Paenibacillus sp. PL91]MBC9200582.1 VOC family protein [Paenibacillus sp. PL91]